jgi:uncharacterized protein YndB with AHSA1/START domain
MTSAEVDIRTPLEHAVERTIRIAATRATIFRHFTDPARFAAWWGAGSHIEAVPGGVVRICYPGGVIASGRVLELVPDQRIVFSYGYEDPAKPIPPGGSRVTVELEDSGSGKATLLRLRHEAASAAITTAHLPGWWFQLALFANLAAADQHAGAAEAVDRFLAAWSEPDAARRADALALATTADVTFQDIYACLAGRDELVTHIAGIQQHVPGMTLVREGPVRHCQGTALADWIARGRAGEERGRGTNVFHLAPDGRISSAVGLWSAPPTR